MDGFPQAITFAIAPVVMNVIAGATAQARIDSANAGCSMRGDAYNLDTHLAISGVFSARQFRAELAATTASDMRGGCGNTIDQHTFMSDMEWAKKQN